MGRTEYRKSLDHQENTDNGGTGDNKNQHRPGNVIVAPDRNRKKKGSRKAVAVILIVLLAVGGVFALWLFWPRTKSQFELDREALEGFLPGRSQQEIEDELNRIIDKGRFNVAINPTPVVVDGKINIMIENVPANNYFMQVDVFFSTNEGPRKIYSSGIIKQGYFIEEASTDIKLAPGEYNGYAVFHALHPETLEEIGLTQATLAGKVE